MKKDYSENCHLSFSNKKGREVSRLAKLELLCIELKNLLEEDAALWPPHQQLIEIADDASEFIAAAERFLDFDPTPQYLYDSTGNEPPATSGELWATDFTKKQELKR
jgi:hypothetical protein